jgi:hypothetical protein
MAKVQRGSRSQAIREYLAVKPEAGPKEVISALKAKGVTVTVGLVSNIKYGGKNKKSRRGRAMTVRAAARRTRKSGLTIDQLLEVKRFADSLGGADQLRRALDTLEQLA